MTKPRKVFDEEGGHGQLTTDEPVMNLGHPVDQDELTQNPVGLQPAYEGPNSELVRSTLDREQNVRGMSGQKSNLESGISTAENLSEWSKYAKSNSYQGDPSYRIRHTKKSR